MSKRKAQHPLPYSVDSLQFKPSDVTQTVVDKQYLQEIPTITALPQDTTNNAPIDFRVDRTENYIDLNETYIYTQKSAFCDQMVRPCNLESLSLRLIILVIPCGVMLKYT